MRPRADRLTVLARTAGVPGDREGLALFLVAPDAPGVRMTPYPMVDRRPGAHIEFDDTPVLQLIGDVDGNTRPAAVRIPGLAASRGGDDCGA
jgi:alkylation response protein AidB-like acyl-CoA dehydrogenase